MGLREDILNQPISSLPLRPLVAVTREMTVREVIHLMRRRRLGCVVLVNEGGEPEGFFSEKILINLIVTNEHFLDDPISDHAKGAVVSIHLTDPIARLIATMEQRRVRWVCVVDDAGRAHSITGARGLFEYMVDHFPRCVMVQPLRSRLTIRQREGA